MATERRRQLLLGAIAVVLALVLYRVWSSTSAGPAPSSNRQGTPAKAAQSGAAVQATPDVHLGALSDERTEPEPSDRNLFRFKTKPPPPPPAPRETQPVATAPGPSAVPSGPPPLPQITLKFIGIVETTERAQKIAILSDGRNVPFYGREGDIIEGRYRILKIGVESIDIAYIDGRGRQTIHLTGG
jgi:hypothetical protein